MKLKPIRANMTELDLGRFVVLFSYKTPVACLEAKTGEACKTSKTWSNTTTRHINSWMASLGVHCLEVKPQEYFDNLITGVK